MRATCPAAMSTAGGLLYDRQTVGLPLGDAAEHVVDIREAFLGHDGGSGRAAFSGSAIHQYRTGFVDAGDRVAERRIAAENAQTDGVLQMPGRKLLGTAHVEDDEIGVVEVALDQPWASRGVIS